MMLSMHYSKACLFDLINSGDKTVSIV